MKKFEKLLSQLSDMETISPDDRLSKLIAHTADAETDDELDEYDLDLVSAAGAPPYQEFLRWLDKRSDRT